MGSVRPFPSDEPRSEQRTGEKTDEASQDESDEQVIRERDGNHAITMPARA